MGCLAGDLRHPATRDQDRRKSYDFRYCASSSQLPDRGASRRSFRLCLIEPLRGAAYGERFGFEVGWVAEFEAGWRLLVFDRLSLERLHGRLTFALDSHGLDE